MYINELAWCKIISCLIFLLARLIMIVDTAGPRTTSTSRQMCTKLQSMLSFGKYQTSQISSNVTYTSRFYAQNFLAYSSVDDLLIFIEPKHQIHVYNAQTIQLLVNLTTNDVVIATSTTSLITDSRHDIYFIYQTNSETNLISLRVCQVQFNLFELKFEDIYCIETIHIQYDQPDLRINGFTIKRDHAGTKKSILFISTDIGLIYTVFDTRLGSLIGESTIMNDTLNDGSIVISSSGVVYYASKQEHLIYELHIQRDFRLRHGKIIKNNAIKHPFGLITDECNHLYIATRSMILVMYVQNRATIRSVFSKASDLPITLERLNSTTYVYGTIRRHSAKTASYWMFNFLYFTDPDRVTPEFDILVRKFNCICLAFDIVIHITPAFTFTILPLSSIAVNLEEQLDHNDSVPNFGSTPKLWPLSYVSSSDPNATKIYTRFDSTPRKPFGRFRKKGRKKTQTGFVSEHDSSSFDDNKSSTVNPLHEQTLTELPDDLQPINPDENIEIEDTVDLDLQDQLADNNNEFDNDLTDDKAYDMDSFSSDSNLTTNQNSSSISTSTSPSQRTIEIAGTIFSEDEIQSYFEGRTNLTSSQEAHIKAYLASQSTSDDNILAKYFKTTNKPQATINIEGTIFNEEDIQAYLQGRANLSAIQEARLLAYLAQNLTLGYNIFSKYSTTTKQPSEISWTDFPGTTFSNEDIQSYLEGRSNLSESQKEQIEAYLAKQSQSQSNANKTTSTDSKFSNRTINIGGTLFSEDDIQAHIEGRLNLTAGQEALIQDYIVRQQSLNNTIFSRYAMSTKPATGIFVSSQNYSTKYPSFDFNQYPEHFDHKLDSNGTVVSNDDLKSYLEGRLNLSASQERLIQIYLARQSSSSFNNIFSKHTTRPSRLILPNGKLFGNVSTNASLVFDEDWLLETYLDRANNTDEILFSYEDLKSYLRGNTNISLVQEAQIQAYLAQLSSTPYNRFSTYSTSTRKPRRSSLPGYLSHAEDSQSEDYSDELLPTDSPSYDRTMDSNELLFSEDDLQGYLDGRTNLSTSQIMEIQAYLAKQMSSNQSTLLKHPNRTKLLTKILSKHFNLSTDAEVTFSEDDLQAYVQGRANLSLAQEAQIQAYLGQRSSTPYNRLSNYSISTRKPRRSSLPGYQRKGNLSLTEDYSDELLLTDSDELLLSEDDLRAYLDDRTNLSTSQIAEVQKYLAKQMSSNQSTLSRYPNKARLLTKILSKHFNSSTDSEVIFSEDDLQAYVEGKANLSSAQEAQIQECLGQQLPNYSTSTRKPRRSSLPGYRRKGNQSLTEDSQSEDYSDELLSADSDELLLSEDDLRAYLEDRTNLSTSQIAEVQKYLAKQMSSNQSTLSRYPNKARLLTKILSKHFNSSTDSEVIFSEDDLQAYVEGKANLSSAQEAQIQECLGQQLPNYSTSTRKPRRSSLPGYRRKGNQSLTEDSQSEDYSDELLLTDLPNYNRTTDSDELLFSEDDLWSYLEDRANLSKTQIAEIQAYLSKQPSSNQSILSKHPNKTRLLTKILSKYLNMSADLEEVFLSEDNLQAYVEARTNLSLTQEAKIRTYLAKQISSGNKTLSRYWTSTKIPTSDDTLNVNLDGQTDSSSESALRKLTSMRPYSTRRRTGIKRPIQFGSNDTNDLEANVEEIYDIYTDSNENDYDQAMIAQDDVAKINSSRFPTRFRSTIHPRFTRFTSSQKPVATNMGSIRFDKTSKPALSYPFASDVDHTPSDSVVISHDNTTNMSSSSSSSSIGDDSSESEIGVTQPQTSPVKIIDTIMPSIHQRNTSTQNQSNFTGTSGSYNDINKTNIENEINHKYSSPSSVVLNVSSTRHPLSPFTITSTTQSSSHRSRTSTPLHYSLVSLSTKSPKLTRSSTSKFFSGLGDNTNPLSSSEEITLIESEPTTVLSYSTIFPLSTSKQQSSHKFSSMQTTDAALTSISKERTTEEQSFTKSDHYTSKLPIQTSSLTYAQSTRTYSTNLGFSSTKLFDKISSRSIQTTVDEKYRAFETTEILPSTRFPHSSKSLVLSTLDRRYPPTISTRTTTITTTTTSTRRLRTGKQKVTRWQTQQPPSTTTTQDYPLTTTNEIPPWRSDWNPPDEQDNTFIEPSLSTTNDSNIVITNDLLNQIFKNISTSTNSTAEKSIFFNLIDLPPSSWNLSLNTNESIFLNVALPSPNYPSYSNATTNLTFTNIEANRFSTNIIGIPVNLQVDRVQTKQFSLTMNATDNNPNRNNSVQHFSDVIIGHVRSEQFELNLTKSDNMHVHVQQVDSSTAELYLDSNFCTNESSLEINLNLSKNGTIRYGNRKPIHIGPVFTRVHMLKQSCDREQPLTLFFDICERENPCANGGTCVSILPDYNDKAFVPTETGHVGYKCQCPLHASGEHCQKLEYPLGYCLNGGNLFQIWDRFNQSIETCICLQGFRGEHCEENIDDCLGIGCSDHGVCEDGIETYKCSCFDGFYGFHCERTNVQTVLIQAASRSFGVIAILLIAGIASLVVASDIHTYLTRKQERHDLLHRIPRVTSELFENSVLLLGFSDAPIEMNDLSNTGAKKKSVIIKPRQAKRTRTLRHTSYRQIARRRQLTTFPKSSSSRRYLLTGQPHQTIL